MVDFAPPPSLGSEMDNEPDVTLTLTAKQALALCGAAGLGITIATEGHSLGGIEHHRMMTTLALAILGREQYEDLLKKLKNLTQKA